MHSEQQQGAGQLEGLEQGARQLEGAGSDSVTATINGIIDASRAGSSTEWEKVSGPIMTRLNLTSESDSD
jgi:hypothetical protein